MRPVITRTTVNAPKLIIEVCPREPRASLCLMNGEELYSDPETAEHVADCARSGDCEPACLYVLQHVGVEFRTVARDADGQYVNRLATAQEKADTCRAIYFDSDADFSDEETVETYLVWEAACNETGR